MEIHWKQAVDARWWSTSCHGWPLQRNTCDRKSGDLLFGSKKWLKIRGIIWEFLLLAVIMNLMISYGYILWLFPCISHFRTQTKSRFIGMLCDPAAPRLKRLRSLPNPQVIVRWLRWRAGDNTFWQQKTTPESLISVDTGWYIILNVSHIALISLECNCLLMRPDGQPLFFGYVIDLFTHPVGPNQPSGLALQRNPHQAVVTE